MKKFNILLYILFLFMQISCQSETDKRLAYALKIAGNNSSELKKVLEHYKEDPEKLEATMFLITNMPAHKGVYTTAVSTLQPIYDKCQIISERHNWERSDNWKTEIDELWKKEKNKLPYYKLAERQDIKQIKANWLIKEIDRSFKAWKENTYSCGASFEDFCHYILPYRFAEGLCMDNSRDVFYKRHAHYFNDPKKDFRVVTDSLHHLYKQLVHNNWAAMTMPIYNAETFEQIKRGSCDQRTWYNCLLMSALGMPIAIDFVPRWANRTGGHSWNSLIIDGQTYPFEPFWDDDRWKYKQIYNNEGFDLLWGKFRLPKVYRHTYESHFEGPINDKNIDKEDIPDLFRFPFFKDVSKEYFQTCDVKIKITTPIPEKTDYCYLCVCENKIWFPVQWGKINKDQTVVFKGMGKDIVYHPMFFKNGTLTPAAPVFLLDQQGEQEIMKCENKKTTIVAQCNTSYLNTEEVETSKHFLSGSYLIGYNEPTQANMDTLYCITDSMDMWDNNIRLSSSKKYRYIKLIPAKDTLALCEISFFEKENSLNPIQHVKVTTDLTPSNQKEKVDRIVDNLSATGFKGSVKNKATKKDGVYFDLGASYTISSFSFIPYIGNKLQEHPEAELFYWDQEWISGGKATCYTDKMTFNDIPEGTIYRININYVSERIFIYKKGIIHWY